MGERNLEGLLIDELLAAMLRDRPIGDAHRKELVIEEPTLSGNGSDSRGQWFVMNAVRLLSPHRVSITSKRFVRDFDRAKALSATRDLAWGFMGIETTSRDFAERHGAAWLVAASAGTSDCRKCAREWLAHLMALCETARLGDRCLLPGQRSPNGRGYVWYDSFFARPGVTVPAVGDVGMVALEKYQPAVDRARRIAFGDSEPTVEAAFDYLQRNPMGMMVHLHWLHTFDGKLVACWQNQTINNLSPPLLAAVVRNGEVTWMPDQSVTKQWDRPVAWLATEGQYGEGQPAAIECSGVRGDCAIPIERGTYIYRSTADGFIPMEFNTERGFV